MMPGSEHGFLPKRWLALDGNPIGCEEKIKILNENAIEVQEIVKDAYEDAILMGCDAGHIKEVLKSMIDALDKTYA